MQLQRERRPLTGRAEDHCPHFSRGFDYPLTVGPVCNNGLGLEGKPLPCPNPGLICDFKMKRIVPTGLPGPRGPRPVPGGIV